MKHKYDEFNHNKYEVHQLTLDLIAGHSRVLDIGCATGCFASALAKKKCEVWGIDKNSQSLKKAGKHCLKTFVIDVDDSSKLPVPKKYFDCVIILDVIEHLTHPENILSLIKPHLKDGGKVILSTPNIAHASIRWMLLQGDFRYASHGIMDDTHVHFYTRDSFGNLLKKNGFRILQMIPTNGMCKVPLLYKISDRLPPSWQYWLARMVPTLFSYQFIAVANSES